MRRIMIYNTDALEIFQSDVETYFYSAYLTCMLQYTMYKYKFHVMFYSIVVLSFYLFICWSGVTGVF